MDNSAYDNQLFKALNKFKNVRMWPDLSGCLQKIIDIFHSYSDVDYVPHKLLFSKTLSQCLSPSLPAGIQSKTLEVYSKVFERIGSEKLSRDFHIWSPGVLQFFHSAGVLQRTLALKLFSDFFLTLIHTNEKVAPPLLLSILPGLIDDGADVKSNTSVLLETIHSFVGNVTFYRALFRAALINHNCKQPFFVFCLNQDPSEIMGSTLPELVNATLLETLGSPNILVVRNALDFFIMCFPHMNNDIRMEISIEVVNLVINEDQSIRRRVFKWVSNYPDDAAKIVDQVNPQCIVQLLSKGGISSNIVESNIGRLLMKNFDISLIVDLVPFEMLFKASKSFPNSLMNLLSLVDLNSDICDDVMRFVITKILESDNSDEIEIYCRIANLTLNYLSFKCYDGLDKATSLIITKYPNNEIILSFVTKLSANGFDIGDPPFSELVNEPLSFTSTKELIKMSDHNMKCSSILDLNYEKCFKCCWNELKSNSDSYSPLEVTVVISKIISTYPSSISLLFQLWDEQCLILLIENLSIIPIEIVIICFNKQKEYDDNKSTHTNPNVPSVLRAIAVKSGKLFPDSKSSITNEDHEYTVVVVNSLIKLINFVPHIVIPSASTNVIMDFVKHLLTVNGTTELLYAILNASSYQLLHLLSKIICEFIISNPTETWSFCLLIPLSDCLLPMRELISCVQINPCLISNLVSVLCKQNSSDSHSSHMRFLSDNIIALIMKSKPSDAILRDIASFLMLISNRAIIEVEEIRNNSKISGLKRLITSSEIINPNNYIAMLTIDASNSGKGIYIPITDYIVKIISEIFLYDINSVEFFNLFDSDWLLIFLYVFTTSAHLQNTKLIGSLLSCISETDILHHLEDLVSILSLRQEKKQSFISLIKNVFHTSHNVFSTDDFIQFIIDSMNTLKLTSVEIIDLILYYLTCIQNANAKKFKSTFMSILSDLKNEVQIILQILTSIDTEFVLSIFGSSSLPDQFIKFFNASNTKDILYPKFISKYANYECESTNWSELLLNLIMNPQLFTCEKEYILEVMNAIKVVSQNYENFSSFYFEKFTLQICSHTWKLNKEQTMQKMIFYTSFVIFSSEYDSFKTKQQSINSQLTLTLGGNTDDLKSFKSFSLLMRVLFIRASGKLVEAFCPILHYELCNALQKDDQEIRNEAEKLLTSAISTIPGSFQFLEYVFYPDYLSFSKYQSEDASWPLLHDNFNSVHLDRQQKYSMAQYEKNLLSEFLECNA